MFATNGNNREISQWYIGDHTSPGTKHGSVSTEWFSDPCWKQIYTHDENGNQIAGSLNSFRQAVFDGHRVKVVYKRVSFEASELLIKNGHISATIINQLSKSDFDSFTSDVWWVWRIICTTGTVNIARYKVGSNTYVSGTTTEKETIAWFIDRREWKKVFSATETGSTSSGSKEVLKNAVENGAEVRYRILFSNVFSVVQQADNLAISDPDVAAMHVRSVSVKADGAYEFKFQPNPFWFFTITSTKGIMEISRWTVGIHQDRNRSTKKFAMEWMVN